MLHRSPVTFLRWSVVLFCGVLTMGAGPVFSQKQIRTTNLHWTPQPNELIENAFVHEQQLVLLTVTADTRAQRSILKAYAFDVASGDSRWTKTLDSVQVGKWQSAAGKGTVHASFLETVASTLNNGQVPPLYQYQTSIAADGKSILAYQYDYSQPTLAVRAMVFDAQGKPRSRRKLSLDNGTTHYGLFLHDTGTVYSLSATSEGDLQLFGYPDGGETQSMGVTASSAQRSQFTLVFKGNEAWVVNLVGNGKQISGTMFSRFDLTNQSTAQVQYLPLPGSVKSAMSRDDKTASLILTGTHVNTRQEISMALENRAILSSGYVYNPNAVIDPTAGQARKAMIEVGTAVVLAYDTLGVLLDERIVPHNQRVDNQAYYETEMGQWIVHPKPGILKTLLSEPVFMRLEKKGKAFILATYSSVY